MDEISELIDQIVPGLNDAVAACGLAIGRYLSSDDLTFKWLSMQWNGAMMVLPRTDGKNLKPLLDHLGYIALTMQRVGLPEFAVFQQCAVGLIKSCEAIIGMSINEAGDTADIATTLTNSTVH